MDADLRIRHVRPRRLDDIVGGGEVVLGLGNVVRHGVVRGRGGVGGEHVRPLAVVWIALVHVGVARHLHALAVAEELAEGDVLQRRALQVTLKDTAFPGLEAGDLPRANKHRLLAPVGAVGDRFGDGAGVLGAEGQRLGEFVDAAANVDRDRPVGLQLAGLIAGPGQCREGPGHRAGVAVVAGRGDVHGLLCRVGCERRNQQQDK